MRAKGEVLESLRMKRSVILSSESQLGGRRAERSGLSVVGLIPSRGNPAAPPPSLKTPRKNEEDTNRHRLSFQTVPPPTFVHFAFPNFILEEDTRHKMKSESSLVTENGSLVYFCQLRRFWCLISKSIFHFEKSSNVSFAIIAHFLIFPTKWDILHKYLTILCLWISTQKSMSYKWWLFITLNRILIDK